MPERVRDGLHAWRPARELVVAEIGLADPGRHDEFVVAELEAIAADPPGDNPVAGHIEVGDLGHHDVHVLVPLEQIAQRGGDLPLGQDARRTLVEQRREYVVLGPVDHRHRYVTAPHRAHREQAGEAAAHDHHAARARWVCHCLLQSVFHPVGSCQVSRSGSSRSASSGPQLPRA